MGRDFYAVLDQVLALLRRRGRVTYNALQLQFNLDNAHLAVLREELLYAYPQVGDDEGRGFVWTADAGPAPAPPQRGTAHARHFQAQSRPVVLLRRNGDN